MNTRIERLNNLMDGRAFFVDPVGLSDEENEKAWNEIIEDDKQKASLLQNMTKAMKDGDEIEYHKNQLEYERIRDKHKPLSDKQKRQFCDNCLKINDKLIRECEDALNLLRRIAKKGAFMDREGLRLVVEDWLNRRNLINE